MVAMRRFTGTGSSEDGAAAARQETAILRVVVVRRGARSGATNDADVALIMRAIVQSEKGEPCDVRGEWCGAGDGTWQLDDVAGRSVARRV